MIALGRLLPKVVRESGDAPEAVRLCVFAAWANAAGPATRRVATPVEYDGRTLHVATVDANWCTQLERLAPKFLFRINEGLGARLVTRVTHRVDEIAVIASRGEEQQSIEVEGVEEYKRLLEPDVAVIGDPELREQFLRMAALCLARHTGHPPEK